MEVENPSLPSFDMQSKPPFPFDSMLSSQECGTSETVLALTAAADALQYESSEPSFGQNPVDAPEYKRSEPWVALDEEVKSATMDVQECATSETVVALSPGVNSATINALENGRSDSMAALKLQKVYRSYRTRRKLADSAVVAEELWWQGIDFARLNHSTISFFNFLKPETAASRWNRISLNASKVGKGLSKDANAQKLAFQHWIEAIDPRHRYGHSLHLYYEEWCKTDAGQPFFYWLDIGDGKEVDLEECPRSKLQQQCIKYLGPQERKHYEYIVVEGKIIHKQTEKLLDTNQGSQGAKWIFVMSTSKKLYAGVKKKGLFHHSSFLAGGATLAAGRLVAENGVLKAISGYSGHYCPTEENLDSFLALLKDKGVNLNEDQIRSSTEDYNYEDIKSVQEESRIGVPKHSMSPQLENPSRVEKTQLFQPTEVPQNEPTEIAQTENRGSYRRTLSGGLRSPRADVPKIAILQRINSKKAASSYQLGHQLSLKWSTGAGPRIGCIADYPLELRVQALEFVNLSPRVLSTPSASQQPGGVDSPTSPSTSDFRNGDGTSTA